METSKKIFIYICFITIPLILFINNVWASGEVSESSMTPFSELLFMVIQVVISVFGVVAVWAARRVVSAVDSRTKVDLEGRLEGMIDGWVYKGANLAEEKSHKLLREKGYKLPGPDKLNVALEFVVDKMSEHGIKEWSKDKLVDYIESSLGQTRKHNEEVAV